MNLPIAERELRVAARTPRTYRGRVIAAAIFGAFNFWMIWAMKNVFVPNPAAMVYSFATNIAMMMCIFQSNVTADSISSEKRSETLGFLFLTDLKGADVVFGKLAASGLVTIYGLLAIIPVMSMPVLLGGVEGQSLFRSAITLINSLFLGLSLGLWISARSWTQKKALGTSAWVSIFVLWGLPGLAALAEFRYHWFEVARILKILSPAYQLEHANPFGIGMKLEYYWTSIAVTHAVAWFALWRACRIVPHSWQDVPEAVLGRFRRRWAELRYGSSVERYQKRVQLLDRNAIHWLTAREKFTGAAVWFFLGVVMTAWVGVWLWITTFPGKPPPFWGLGIPIVFVMHLGLKLRTAAIAAESIARDRLSGALELLLSTSLPVSEVVRGIWMTFRRVLLRPILTVFVLGAAVYYFALQDARENRWNNELTLAFICLNIWFAVDLIAAVWTGMWMACVTRQANAPAGQTLVRLAALPCLAFALLLSLLSFLGIQKHLNFQNVFLTFFAIAMVNSVFWLRRSRRQFYDRLRFVAAERYQPVDPNAAWWKFWTWLPKEDASETRSTPAPATVP